MSLYRWRAIHEDGFTLEEKPNDEFAVYSNINRKKLRVFELFNKETKEVKLSIKFYPGQRLIWRRRKEMAPGGKENTVHIVGKQQTINGANKQGIALLFERDGTVEFFERFDPSHPFLRPIKLLPEER
jgi:hypothetical protein